MAQPIMVSFDKDGRIVLPQKIRVAAELPAHERGWVEVEVRGGEIVLTPVIGVVTRAVAP